MTIRREHPPVLLDGIHHIAILSSDTDRLVDFYQQVFDATVEHASVDGPVRLTFLNIGPHTELNVFEIDGNDEAEHQTPMFGRGRLDHVGLRAASIETFSEIRRRLIDLEATDGFVTDFGPVLSLFFTDPDGLEGEVCVPNPDAQPDVRHPPGTPAARFDAPRRAARDPGHPRPDHDPTVPEGRLVSFGPTSSVHQVSVECDPSGGVHRVPPAAGCR